MQYRREIDGLRAVAVLPVILFHAGLPLFSGGYVGVDVFFVISGFLITSIILAETRAGTFSVRGFCERRARRILPALLLVTVASAVPAYLWMTPEELQDFSESVISVALFYSNFHFASETGYFAVRGDLKPLLHTWSLAVEEQYYLLAPLAFMLLWRRSVGVLAGATAVVAVMSLGVAEWGARQWPDVNFFFTPSRIWEIMIGALAAYAVPQPGGRIATGRMARETLSALGLACILFAVFAFDAATPFPSVYALAPTLGTALILMFADERTMAGRVLSLRVFVGIGLVSYSAYLWHQPLFAYARLLQGAEPPHIHFLALTAVTFVLAYLSWRLVERPFRARRMLTRRQVFSLSAAAGLLLVAAGAYGALSGGMLYRFEGRELAFFENLEEGMGSCREDLDYDLGSEAPCLIGDVSQPPSLVIFGDSHGGPVAAGIGPILEAKGQSALVFGQGRCPPLVGTMTLGIPRDDRRCLDHVDDVIDVIAKLDGIETILLASRWERYAYSDTFVPLPEVKEAAADGDGSAFETALRATVDVLASEGREIVILRQVPPPPFDAVARMFDRLSGRLDTGRIEFPLERSHFEALASNAAIDLVDRRTDVEAFDPYPVLCNGAEGECLAGNNGVPYYRDDNHLWNRGAIMLGAELAKVL